MNLIGIDPGKHGSGIAARIDGKLVAEFLRSGEKSGFLHEADAVCYEKPQIYSSIQSADPNDLIDLVLCSLLTIAPQMPKKCAFFAVQPKNWKGQIPKKAHHAQLLKLPEVREIAEQFPKTLRHNVIDAIGILFFFEKNYSFLQKIR